MILGSWKLITKLDDKVKRVDDRVKEVDRTLLGKDRRRTIVVTTIPYSSESRWPGAFGLRG